MSAFLNSVAKYIYTHYKDTVEKLCIVLPNKRGALFLKKHLAQEFGSTIWLPTIISAEELITELSGLKTPEEIDLICHLYESYKVCYGSDAESFDSFAKWGQLILQDFNEIDRYLADPEQIYENLKDIKVIENWSLGEESLTAHQTAYLHFMSSMGAIYKHYTNFLLEKKWAYQGLAYRYAALNYKKSHYPDQFHKMIFCGFNALNAAELQILSGLQVANKADLLWDADKYYLDDLNQEAGLFLRKNLELFGQREPLFIGENFKNAKNIRIVSVPKQIGQAQVVKQAIQKYIDEGIPLDTVAVVLANEKLLWPVLQQMPAGVEFMNITMEYPLRYTSTYSMLETLIQIQVGFSKQLRRKAIYHKDFVSLLRHPLFKNYLHLIAPALKPDEIVTQIAVRNLSFISAANLKQLLGGENNQVFSLLTHVPAPAVLCDLLIAVVQTCIKHFSHLPANNHVTLELEYLYIFQKNFTRLKEILLGYQHFNNIYAFRQLFSQVVGNATAPFVGEPLRGLQVMGVLETRTLDFEHLIIVNVNEGILPSGKTVNSFIPNDLKRAFGLPLYLEKDAIYAYHFYRLLQKAGEVTITYDSETDTFGKGEKSRFVTQLQLELKQYNPEITISEQIASYPVFPKALKNAITIHKNDQVLLPVMTKAANNEKFGGLSPSGLITFKECGLKFYFRYGVHLRETEEVEESAEANTFGSILHLSLENLYREFCGKIVSTPNLKIQLQKVDEIVNASFLKYFDNNAPSGKNLLQQEVIKVYVKKLLDQDLKFISRLAESNQFLTLIHLEEELSAPLEITLEGRTVTVYIKGKMDRLDTFGGKVRIIDYKSSVKDTDKFIFDGYPQLFHDCNYNKQLQLFIYAWLAYKNNLCEASKLMPCIIPFKVFTDEPKGLVAHDKKPLVFSSDLMHNFEAELKNFIEMIFNKDTSFQQTSDDKIHQYCPYNAICNFKV
jgi:hypothetical protein